MVAKGLWEESKGQRERERGTTITDREKLPWSGQAWPGRAHGSGWTAGRHGNGNESGSGSSSREVEENLNDMEELLSGTEWNRLEQRRGSSVRLQQRHLELCSVAEQKIENWLEKYGVAELKQQQ